MGRSELHFRFHRKERRVWLKEGLPRTLLTEALSKPQGESQKCRCGDSGSSLQVRSGPCKQ